jgi:hypothetical protein
MESNDVLQNPEQDRKLPTGLNVLTILTLIMCAYELYSAVSTFLNGKKAMEKLTEAQDKMENAPGWVKKLAGPEVMEMMEKSIANKVPILIVSLVAVALCVYGALEMRKLKKQGYFLWLIGELLPVASVLIFIGGVFFKTMYAWMLIFPAIFILLYTLQRKYLTK